jgi:hypothetical protein
VEAGKLGGRNGGWGNSGDTAIWTPTRGLGTIVRIVPLTSRPHWFNIYPNFSKNQLKLANSK